MIEFGFRRATLGRAVGLGIASHLVLDLLTHARDIVLWAELSTPKIGLGLYDTALMAAFFLEMAYGLACWRLYRGGTGLLAVVVLANLANLSFFSVAIQGPEIFLAGRPALVVSLVLFQIIVTLVLVGALSRRPTSSSQAALPGRR